MVIYFVRHGQVDNPNQIKYGRLPGFPLTPKGRQEVLQTAQKLKNKDVEAIFASPLLRTKETAEVIAQKLNLPINYDDRLLEHDHGRYTGVPIEEFKRMEYWRDGAETLEQSGNRVLDFLDEIKSQNKYQTIAVVSHGGPVVMAILNRAGKTVDNYDSIKFPTGGFIEFEF